MRAEADEHGAVFYGIIQQYAIRRVSASELAEVTPLKRVRDEL